MRVLPPAFSALANYPQFIVYFLSPRSGSPGKMDKLPVHPVSHQYPVSALDPKHWLDVSAAIELSNTLGDSYGVGFTITPNDPFFLIDIDACLTPENTWSQTAHDLIRLLPGAALEVSTSGRGLHIIGTGKCPPHTCHPTGSSLEMYHENRFVALTGIYASGDVATDCTIHLPAVIDKYFPINATVAAGVWTVEACPEWHGPENDEELIKRALKSQSGLSLLGNNERASFHDLWNANEEILRMAYPPNDTDVYNRSVADAALAQHLVFWTGANCERIERLMRKSALSREKWQRADYLRVTVQGACAKKTAVLQDKPTPIPITTGPTVSVLRGRLRGSTTFLSPSQQVDFFQGCCYVRDAHAVLVPGGELIKPDQFKASYGGYLFILSDDNAKTTDDPWKAFRLGQAVEYPWANGSCFRPDLSPGAVIEKSDGRRFVNSWWPVNVRRLQGDLTPFFNLLQKLFPVERDRMIILSYMAACAQYPGVKFRWCPLVQGVQGNGKTLLSRCVEQAVGERYTQFPRAHEITNRFNEWIYGNIFIGIDDIYVPDAKLEVLEILKPIIDRERYEVEPKGRTKMTLDVCTNFMLNTNHKDALKMSRNERRFAVFYTPQQTVEDLTRDGMDGDYFPKLFDWLKKDGFAIVAELLHTYQIPEEFNPATICHRAPGTSTTESAIHETRGVIEHEILEAIEQGEIGFRNGWISSIFLDQYLENRGLSRRMPYARRREMLQSLGYDWHPALTDGRTNNTVMPDGKKPRLFIKKDHKTVDFTSAIDIAKAYTEDQNL